MWSETACPKVAKLDQEWSCMRGQCGRRSLPRNQLGVLHEFRRGWQVRPRDLELVLDRVNALQERKSNDTQARDEMRSGSAATWIRRGVA